MVTNLSETKMVVMDMSFMNMLLIFSTLGVLKLERSRSVSFSQSLNISCMFTTFLVSKLATLMVRAPEA